MYHLLPALFFSSYREEDERERLRIKMAKIRVRECLKGSALTLATLAGVLGGVAFGLILRESKGKDGEEQQ